MELVDLGTSFRLFIRPIFIRLATTQDRELSLVFTLSSLFTEDEVSILYQRGLFEVYNSPQNWNQKFSFNSWDLREIVNPISFLPGNRDMVHCFLGGAECLKVKIGPLSPN